MNSNRENLENLIDLATKRSIALLNLMGFRTGWSCCGFNYPGDGDRSHEIGRLYIQFEHHKDSSINDNFSDMFRELLTTILIEDKSKSVIRLSSHRILNINNYQISYDIPKQCDNWDSSSKHYFELPVGAITLIEKFLLSFGNTYELFTNEEVTLVDKYEQMANRHELYEYIITSNKLIGIPWIIKRDDYLEKTDDNMWKLKRMNFAKHNK